MTEHWARLEQRQLSGNDLVCAALELRARVEALEAAANYPAKPDSLPAPAGSLVERVQTAIGRSYPDNARAAIREVAAWLRDRAGGTRACWLLDVEAGE